VIGSLRYRICWRIDVERRGMGDAKGKHRDTKRHRDPTDRPQAAALANSSHRAHSEASITPQRVTPP